MHVYTSPFVAAPGASGVSGVSGVVSYDLSPAERDGGGVVISLMVCAERYWVPIHDLFTC